MQSSYSNSSLLYGCHGEVNQSIQFAESILVSIIFVAMIIFAIQGNTLVIITILKNQKLRTPKNSFLCSLAFIDLLSPICRVLPIAISTMKAKWIFGCDMCVITSAAGVFFCSSSILHLCAITVERFLTISFNQRSKVWINKSNMAVVLVLIWGLALMMALLPYKTPSIKIYFNEYVLLCDFYLGSHPGLSLIMTSLYFCLPVVLMMIVYCRIYNKLHESNRKMFAYKISQESYQKHRRVKREWKTVKLVIGVIGTFFVLWCPYFSVTCVKSYYPNQLPGWLERFALTCAYLNSCSNFIVYSIMNTKLRRAFKEFFVCPCRSIAERGGFNERSLSSIKAVIRSKNETLYKREELRENNDGISVVMTTARHGSLSCVLETNPEQNERKMFGRDRGYTF